LLKSAATLTREIKPYYRVSSFRGANTLLQGQQNKGRTQKEQITEGRLQKAVQQTDKSSRSKVGPTQIRENQIKGVQRTRAEEPGPLRDATSEGQTTL
jgi:hypothetical protein